MRYVISLIGLLLTLPLMLLAEDSPPEGFGSGHTKQELVSLLHLTASQIEKLSCDTPFKGKDLLRKLSEEKQKLDSLMKNKGTPVEAIQQQFGHMQRALEDFHRHRLSKILQIREVLNQDQLDTFMEIKKTYSPDLLNKLQSSKKEIHQVLDE